MARENFPQLGRGKNVLRRGAVCGEPPASASATVLFQLVNLPVEFDASRRARQVLLSNGLITQDEDYYVKRVLDAAALFEIGLH